MHKKVVYETATFCVFIVRLLQAFISMNEYNYAGGDPHDIEVILSRDQYTQPVVLWSEEQCFKIFFENPYKLSTYYPFQYDHDGNGIAGKDAPVCQVS